MTENGPLDELDTPDPKIGDACRELIAADEKITLRSVAAKLGVAHTTLSRDAERRDQVQRARNLQKLAVTIRGTQRGHITSSESLPLARANLRIKELKEENALLIASHRAMIMAVGEIGGMRAYRRFFEAHQAALSKLADIKAIPDPVTPLRLASVADEGDA